MVCGRAYWTLVADRTAALVRGGPEPEHDDAAARALPMRMLNGHDASALSNASSTKSPIASAVGGALSLQA